MIAINFKSKLPPHTATTTKISNHSLVSPQANQLPSSIKYCHNSIINSWNQYSQA